MTRPPVPDKQLTDVVEKCRDRFAEYVELHRAKLTDDAVLNVREAIWRKVEHNQEMVRMCDEALASLNTAPAGDDVIERVAAAIHEARFIDAAWPWAEEDARGKDYCRRLARAAIASLNTAPAGDTK